jgi:hypothetical protein
MKNYPVKVTLSIPFTVFLGQNGIDLLGICEDLQRCNPLYTPSYSLSTPIPYFKDFKRFEAWLTKTFPLVKLDLQETGFGLKPRYAGVDLNPIFEVLAVIFQILIDNRSLIVLNPSGLHHWSLWATMNFLREIALERDTQILIPSHTYDILRFIEPAELRIVEYIAGQLTISALPLDSPRFKKAYEVWEGDLIEIINSNLYGGNPDGNFNETITHPS